ncbi:MAG: plastocyanin/azurin family copper-binding protein [Candidatus Nitrosocosmicus sp.]|nr:plastocyanin/azurin family copper-binding protein [Candidatus Nitrosocosmicus sp.]MDN5867048.1 plastocyanin/azurin family copper-binding protein [Candidatus Nitrosocosmicus sp.]
MSHVNHVVIPNFIDDTSTEKYFIPRYITITKGDSIEWTNLDMRSHTLVYYKSDAINEIFDESEPILPGKSITKEFDYDEKVITYKCKDHDETGTIVIYPGKLNNTEQLRFLQETFDIKVPDILKHLSHSDS